MSGSPLALVRAWYEDAVAAGLPEPNAMALATASPDGVPAVRFLLLKDIDDEGVDFFTNYESRKGRELAANPRAALAMYWQPLARQVRLEGRVEVLRPRSPTPTTRRGRAAAGSGRGPRPRAARSPRASGSRRASPRPRPATPATTYPARRTGAATGSCPRPSSCGRAG